MWRRDDGDHLGPASRTPRSRARLPFRGFLREREASRQLFHGSHRRPGDRHWALQGRGTRDSTPTTVPSLATSLGRRRRFGRRCLSSLNIGLLDGTRAIAAILPRCMANKPTPSNRRRGSNTPQVNGDAGGGDARGGVARVPGVSILSARSRHRGPALASPAAWSSHRLTARQLLPQATGGMAAPEPPWTTTALDLRDP